MKLRTLRAQRAELRNTVQTLTHKLAAMECERNAATNRVASLPSSLSDATHQISWLRSRVAALERHNEHLLQRTDHQVSVVYHARSQAALHNATFTDTMYALHTDLADLRHERDHLLDRLHSLEHRLVDSDADRCMLYVVSVERDRLEERLQHIHNVHKSHAKVHSELANNKRLLETVTKKLLEACHRNNQLRLDNEAKIQNEHSMRQMFGDLKKECERLQLERDQAAELEQQLTAQLAALRRHFADFDQLQLAAQRAHTLEHAYSSLARAVGQHVHSPVDETATVQLNSFVQQIVARYQQSATDLEALQADADMHQSRIDQLNDALEKERHATAQAELRIDVIAEKHVQLATAIGHRECPLDPQTGLANIYPHARRLAELTESQQSTILNLRENLVKCEAEAETTSMQVEKLKRLRRTMKADAEQLESRVHSLEAEVAALSRENSAMKNSLQYFEEQSHQRQGISEVLRLEKERNAANVRDHGVEMAHLRAQLAERDALVEKSVAETKRLHEIVSDLQTTCTTLQGEKLELDGQASENSDKNQRMEAEMTKLSAELHHIRDERDSLQNELREQGQLVSAEREELAVQLAERTANFAELEAELNDARKTYIEAANNFEAQRAALEKQLGVSQREKEQVNDLLVAMSGSNEEGDKRLEQAMKRCEQLEQENDGLRLSVGESRQVNRNVHLRSMTREEDSSSFRSDSCSVTSSLTTSSAGSEEGLGLSRRVQQLQSRLDEETRVREDKAKRLREAEQRLRDMRGDMEKLKNVAKDKEREADGLRNEMKSIHSRMRKMAHVSMPRDYEKWLEGDDEDLERLQQVREATRKEREVDRRSKGRRKSKGVMFENKGR